MIKYICDHCGCVIRESGVKVLVPPMLEGKKFHLCEKCCEEYSDIEDKFYREMSDTLLKFLTEGELNDK